MTTKEKAQDLVDKYRTHIRAEDSYIYLDSDDELHLAKKCSLGAVDEIIKTFDCTTPQSIEYWEKVKQELNK